MAAAAHQQPTKPHEGSRSNGYRVLRYWNNDVLTNIDGVLEDIQHNNTTPTPNPSPQGGGEHRACGTFTSTASRQRRSHNAGQPTSRLEAHREMA